MLNDILRALCPSVGLTFVSFEDELFLNGVAARSVDVRAEFRETGYCYGGFRHFAYFPVPILDSAKTILLVRDPRDILVSLYFAVAYSHAAPESAGSMREKWLAYRNDSRSTSIDDWVLRNCGPCLRAMDLYLAQQFPSRPNVIIYRYEDIIFRKRDWIADIVDWYEWDVPEQLIADVARSVDVVPAFADPGQHVRQVLPGNHKTLLKSATQQQLSSIFSDFLTLFGYPF